MSVGPVGALGRTVRAALEAGRPERALDHCAAAARGAPDFRVRRHAALLLAAVAPRVPVAARTSARRGAVRGLLDPWPEPPATVGAVAFPTVRGECGGCTDDCFVVARVSISAAAGDDLPAGLDPTTRAAVQAALAAARALTQSDAGLALRVDGPGGWRGDSLGLAVALAAVSALTGRRVPHDIVATGRVTAAGRVEAVGHLPAKSTLLREARPRARMLVAQANHDQDPKRTPVSDLDGARAEVWRLGTGQDLDVALDQVRSRFKEGRWLEAAGLAASLGGQVELEDSERVELLGMQLAAANHSGDATHGTELEAELEALLAAGLRGEAAAQALGSLAVKAVDALDADTAEGLAERAISLLPADSEHLVHALGPMALVRRLQGRFEASVALRRRSLGLAHRTEHPRCLGDLSAALLNAGHPAEALAQAEAALATLDGMRRRPGYRETTRPFVRHHQARALAANGRVTEARAIFAEVAAFPGLAPSLFAHLADCALDPEAGLARVEQHQDRQPAFIRDLPIIDALYARARAQLGDARAAARLCTLLGLPGDAVHEAGRRLPY